MSITGLFLMLFLLVHLTANLTSLVSAQLFVKTCHMMGSNPFILAMTPILAAGAGLHFLYAGLLTLHNLRALGLNRYAAGNKNSGISWASKNMFLLGLVVFGGLALHLLHFWSKMQLADIIGGVEVDPYELLRYQFSQIHIVIIYVVWVVALWLHLTHGFWSAFQTIGLSNKNWIKRLQIAASIYATLVSVGFISIPIYFYCFL